MPTLAAQPKSEERVTPLELFYDLVFVLAITQVTGLMADNLTWSGLGEGMLILGTLWWMWVGYSWLTNVIDPEEGLIRLAFFAAMAAALICALAVPEAFGDEGVVFGVAYFIGRALHIAIYRIAAQDDPELRAQIGRFSVVLVFAALIPVAGLVDGPAKYAIWAFAAACDYGVAVVAGVDGWRLDHPAHFAERHGLIIIIALGESIVAIGLGAGTDLTAANLTAATLAIVVVGAMWWGYFDVVALVAERKLTERTGRDRILVARDGFSFLHFPMIAGIVLFALGTKKTLEHTGEELKLVAAVGLCGGVALYYLAHIAARLRNVRTLNRRRLVAVVGLVALIPITQQVSALTSLALVALVCATLTTYETVRYAERRAEIRHAREAHA